MKLAKKITFKRVMELPQFKKVVEIFEKFKKDVKIDKNNSIKKTKEASKLKYFIVIEFENVFKNRINFDSFYDKDKNKGEIINIDRVLEEKEKLEKYLSEKKADQPQCFSKLGIVNEVLGCYLVGTNKKNVNFVNDLDLKNKKNNIIIKFDNKDLPKEINQICNDYYKKTQEDIKRQKEEFDRFLKFNSEEQDFLIKNLIDNINSPFNNQENNGSALIIFDNIYYSNFASSGYTFFDGFSEKNLKTINSIELLEALRINAEEKEQFEFCAKIRDRIKEIRSQFENM
jgi:hypothetical protein